MKRTKYKDNYNQVLSIVMVRTKKLKSMAMELFN